MTERMSEHSVKIMKEVDRLTPREIRALKRRNQLIDTALAVFAQKGVENATIKDLAEAAGVAQGLIYHYFTSKEDLLGAVVERHGFLPQMRRILASPHERPAAEVLLETATGFHALLKEKEQLVRVFFREAQTNPAVAAKLSELIREGVDLVARYLAARVAAGELRPHNSEVTARTLLYTVFMAHLTRLPGDRFLPEMVDGLLTGIQAR